MPSSEEQRDNLARRLEDGWNRINEAERAGKSVAAWEDFWLGLLHEYEQLCDELDRAADQPATQRRFA